MSINSEINRISNNVDDALAATAEMGATVPATASSDNLGSLIRAIPRVNVVQSIGSSTADVMSQAAVTNALNDRSALWVNMTDAESDDPDVLMVQADKTYEQVVAAYAAGRPVYARYKNADDAVFVLPIIGAEDGLVAFMVYTGYETMAVVMSEGFGNYAVFESYYTEDVIGFTDHLVAENPHNVTAGQVGAPTVAEMNAAVNAAKYTHPTSHPASMITGLATVATSGSYNDLANKPTIPAAVTVDSALSSSSTNPVQNKVVNSALADKLPLAGGTVSGTITLSNSSAQSGQPGIKWKAVNSKTPYVGYCTGSTDATFMVGSLAGTTYQTGLSIGGSSGNLLWKGTKVATTADLPTLSSLGAAAATHNHGAGEITSGTLAVARGGTGVTSNPSMLTNLGSTSAASVFAASPRPGVTGTLPIANGGTGATSASAARTALEAAPAYTYGTADLTAGSSSLATGVLYFVYE